jgi:hypothetical protein
MKTHLCVSNRDINCFINVILSNLNNNNFSVIIFYKFLIVYNLITIFHLSLYFTAFFVFFLVILFQFPFLIYSYTIGTHILIKLIDIEYIKINLHKETIVFKIWWIAKIFFNQIKSIPYNFKKENYYLELIKSLNTIKFFKKKYLVKNQHQYYYVFE